MTAFRALDGFPGSPAFLSIGHLRLFRLSAIIFDQLMYLLLVGVMIAIAEGTHVVSPLQGFVKLPIMGLFPVRPTGLCRYLERILPPGVILHNTVSSSKRIP